MKSLEDVDINKLIDIRADNKATIMNLQNNLKLSKDVLANTLHEILIFNTELDRLSEEAQITDQISENNTLHIVSKYNTSLTQLMQRLHIHLATKLQSKSGRSSYAIRKYTPSQKKTPWRISYKLPDYSWIKEKPICSIDNILITSSSSIITIAGNNVDMVVSHCLNIGSSSNYYIYSSFTSQYPHTGVALSSGTNLDQFVSTYVPEVKEVIYNINLALQKNVTIISTTLLYIDNIIENYDLYDI
jgi:hypothetical protein